MSRRALGCGRAKLDGRETRYGNMAVEPFANGVRQSSSATQRPAAVDQESLWIGAALAHVKEHGELDALPSTRSERLAVMTTVVRRGLVCWDKTRDRYV